MPKNMNIYKNKMSYKQKKILFTLMKQLLWNTSKLKQNKQHILVFDWKNFTHEKKKHTSLFCNKIGIKSALLLVIFFSRDFSWGISKNLFQIIVKGKKVVLDYFSLICWNRFCQNSTNNNFGPHTISTLMLNKLEYF